MSENKASITKNKGREFWVVAWSPNFQPVALHFPTYRQAENKAKKLVLLDYTEAVICSEMALVERAVGVSKFR